MKENPASSSAFRLPAESIPASATTTMSDPVALLERLEHRHERGGLGLAPVEGVHLQREPARVHQQPDLDLRIDAVLLTGLFAFRRESGSCRRT
ncbi:hypothetical protein AB5L97_12180 [Sinomonas sp. P10A9]|uniref:Uncharacterized protein n=1 Tax=Sinomonas puerhi TaxID=3238584 RepID=A0AB39L0K5_9MICC